MLKRYNYLRIRRFVILAIQSVRECCHCDERSDEAISNMLLLKEIASLRSQRQLDFHILGQTGKRERRVILRNHILRSV